MTSGIEIARAIEPEATDCLAKSCDNTTEKIFNYGSNTGQCPGIPDH